MKLLAISALVLFTSVHSHGGLSVPPSRQWQCSGGASPNLGVQWNGRNGIAVCQPSSHAGNINNVITNWSGVSRTPDARTSNPSYDDTNPRQIHVNDMGGLNSKICSANRDFYSALDEPVWSEDLDGAYPVEMDSGNQLFEYKMTAAHRTFGTGYYHVYITKDGWNSAEEPTWNSMENTPFCRYAGDSTFSLQKTDTWSCDVPEKSGTHMIFVVWQRDDSPEVFYSCSDVVFDGTDPTVETTNAPTDAPTDAPTIAPTDAPTEAPTDAPTDAPTNAPTDAPTDAPGLTTESPNAKYNLFHVNHIKFGESSLENCVSKTPSNRLTTISCARDSNEQQFFNHLNYQIRSENNFCWEIDSSRGLQFINLVLCEDYKKAQMFSYDSDTGSLHPSENFDYCVTKVGPMLAALPCKNLEERDDSVFGLKIFE